MGKSELRRLKRQQDVPYRPAQGETDLSRPIHSAAENGERDQVHLVVKGDSLGGHPYLPGEESWEDISWFDDVA